MRDVFEFDYSMQNVDEDQEINVSIFVWYESDTDGDGQKVYCFGWSVEHMGKRLDIRLIDSVEKNMIEIEVEKRVQRKIGT